MAKSWIANPHMKLGVVALVVTLLGIQSCSREKETTAPIANPVSEALTERAAQTVEPHIDIDALITSGRWDELRSRAATPFALRIQNWSDSSVGIEIGESSDTIAGNEAELADVFATLEVMAAGAEADEFPPARDAIMEEYLAGAEDAWDDLETKAFIRESGDVIHYLILGLDSEGNIRAAFLN